MPVSRIPERLAREARDPASLLLQPLLVYPLAKSSPPILENFSKRAGGRGEENSKE